MQGILITQIYGMVLLPLIAGFVLTACLMVTESVRALTVSSCFSKQVQKTCSFWLSTFWLLIAPSALYIVSNLYFTRSESVVSKSVVPALRAFLGREERARFRRAHLLRAVHPGLRVAGHRPPRSAREAPRAD